MVNTFVYLEGLSRTAQRAYAVRSLRRADFGADPSACGSGIPTKLLTKRWVRISYEVPTNFEARLSVRTVAGNLRLDGQCYPHCKFLHHLAQTHTQWQPNWLIRAAIDSMKRLLKQVTTVVHAWRGLCCPRLLRRGRLVGWLSSVRGLSLPGAMTRVTVEQKSTMNPLHCDQAGEIPAIGWATAVTCQCRYSCPKVSTTPLVLGQGPSGIAMSALFAMALSRVASRP
jgi:hypothetical protein